MPDPHASRAQPGRAACLRPGVVVETVRHVAAVAHVRSLSLATSLEPAAARAVAETPTRPLGARSMLDARSFMISTLRSQVGLGSASPRPLRMLASASRVSSSSRALAAPPAVTHILLPRAPLFRRLPSSRRGEALCRRFGSGWRQGRVRWGRPLLSRPRGAVGSGPAAVLFMRLLSRPRFRPRPSRLAWSCGCVKSLGWMVVRFVFVIRVPVCARVSRVCPVCVPAPPVSFLP